MENGRGGDGDGGSEEDVSFICAIFLVIYAYFSLGFYLTIPSRCSGQAGAHLDRTARHRRRMSNGKGPAQSG